MKNFGIKKAFTLAEVLITLGIIGVIAAMTIPALMVKYQKRQVEAKLPKFYSTINQAMMLSTNANGGNPLDLTDVTSSMNKAKLKDWYSTYIIPYLNHAAIEDDNSDEVYLKIRFADGSGFWTYLQYTKNGHKFLWMNYCINLTKRDCPHFEHYDGKNGFLFRYYPEDENMILPSMHCKTPAIAKNNCYNNYASQNQKHACSCVLYNNNWKIPADYPWIK